MKTNRWSIVTLLLVGTAGLASAQCAGPLSYGIPIVPGFNLIANQLNCGGNTLPEIMPTVPDGTVCSVFNNATKSYQVASYIAGFGWDVPLVLRPGAGAFLQSPVAFVLTLRGSANVPVLPVPLAAGACCILSRQTNAVGTYETIVGAPPAEGTTLYRWNEPTQSYEVFTYDLGAWTPFVPTAAIGEALVICTPASSITLCGTQPKWSQLPGYRVFTNSPTMRGGDRPSDVDWKTLMAAGTNIVDPNWIIADDFRSDGRPILTLRWWGSYLSTAAAAGLEDGFVLSFFSDVPTNIGPAGGFSRPGNLLGTYVAPVEAVRRRETQHIGWDGFPIYQYEVNLKDTCLDHAVSGLATPRAFLEQSNIIYWLAITAEVGHRIVAVTNANGQVVDWVQTQTNKRATNHFWGWHTSPTNRLDLSVMGHLFMPTPTNWFYPSNQWRPNQPFHMELDQAFELLTCDTNPPFIVDIDISCESNKVVVRFNEPVDPATATVPGNYSMQALSATLIDPNTVCVLFPPCQTNYWVLIHNIADTCGNVMPVGIDFHPICPPCSAPKIAKWTQLPGYLVFTNAGQNPDMHGGDRYSDVDWVTLMQAGTNLVQPNWVIADDFRSDGRPILCVRWWGSYRPGFEPTSTGTVFEDGYVLSFFSDFRPLTGGPSRPNQLLGTYVAPVNAVKVIRTPFIGWDSNRIYQYEVALEDTCLDHASPNIARPNAFLEVSNTVYWLAVTAEVGHRVVPITNATGQVVDWIQTQTNKRATDHFWGWHTAPTNREDLSVMGHVYMLGTNWLYPTNQWMPNQPFHMELDQAFQLLTSCDTNPPRITNFNFSCDTLKLIIEFNDVLDPVSATDLNNYGGPGIVSSVILIDNHIVCVAMAPAPCGMLFGLCITGIKDVCGNVMSPGLCIDFFCPCPSVQKVTKWDQLPGYLVFTNAGENPNMHGGDRPSDVDWLTLLQGGTNILQPNWVIADNFRSDGRPIVCVRWWGSYLPGVQPGFEDGFVLSFFGNFPVPVGDLNRPGQLLGSYVAPKAAVKVTDTGFIGWDSNRIYQYEVALEDTCLDHAVPGLATPGAFLEQSNIVYWLAITAQVGCRVIPLTNDCGAVIDWVQTFSEKRATNHFWGWHTSPTNRLDPSVMGHLLMVGTNWIYPTNMWMANPVIHMERDQAFVLLTTNRPPNPKRVKWSQPPGWVVFTNSPQMHGGDRFSDVDWVTLMQNPTAFVQPNWVIADDFRSDGRPILAVRWWGSYPRTVTPGFEDGFVLSFFSDFRPAAGGSSRPDQLLGSYVAPRSAVRASLTPYIGWDSNCIYQYEVNLRDTCLDHAVAGLATPRAFLERSNIVYWVAITAEVGHRVVPIRNAAGLIVDWQQVTTGKRATNHYWGWHTSPIQREDVSVMGHVLMSGTNWIFPVGQWQANDFFHMELDQAFELLTCPLPPALRIVRMGANAEISWDGDGFRLQAVPSLDPPGPPYPWADLADDSPVVVPMVGPHRFFRAICP